MWKFSGKVVPCGTWLILAASPWAARSSLGIFRDRPMEPAEAAAAQAATPAAPEKTDLEKYLLLAQEPM